MKSISVESNLSVYYVKRRFAFLPTKVAQNSYKWLQFYYDVMFYTESFEHEELHKVARAGKEHIAHLLAKNWEKLL